MKCEYDYSCALDMIAMIYVLLPLAFLLCLLIYLLFKGKIQAGSSTALIDFGKWYLGGVVVVFLGKMIESGFTERETGIKEIAVFDKYTTIVMNNDSLAKQYALAKYFSIVTPTTRLRERWDDYAKYVDAGIKKNKTISEKLAVEKDSNKRKVLISEQQANLSQYNVATDGRLTARILAKKGFTDLTEHNMPDAIEHFTQSEAALNGYDASFEMMNYLISYQKAHPALTDLDWKTLITYVYTKYRGYITPETQEKMRQAADIPKK